jgi:LPXTG-motif cell wall-anchored protein
VLAAGVDRSFALRFLAATTTISSHKGTGSRGVGGKSSGPPSGGGGPPRGDSGPLPGLPGTGVNVLALISAGIWLIVAGAALLLRRRTEFAGPVVRK